MEQIKSYRSSQFKKSFEKLPLSVQEQAKKAYALWSDNPFHNSLEFKVINKKLDVYSARISLNWRVLGLF
ncbi:MAG: hypothetical protein HQM11_13845 [SAR324 cluster bacterium]|nr:hypothetical protein [Desulfobulbaceae bacterium]MBF0352110.1 hypothetical protein [SAR324 cluster bacterium]